MLIHYKCPDCGNDMKFSSETGNLACDSCGRQDNIEEYPKEFITHEFAEGETVEYQCNNCGAVVLSDADTVATTCCFCGAGVVMADRLSGKLAPMKVIPFTISKDQAKEAFKAWCRKGRLTPKGFMTADRVQSVTGMYVPFWLYDLRSIGAADAVCTRVRTYSQGDYNYTETSFYDVHRKVDLKYVKVPVDASEKMDDELMDKLEPYDYRELKDFNTPYLAGYLAEKYNYDDKQLFPRVKSRVDEYVDTYIRSTITGYSSTRIKHKTINTKPMNAYYTLIPVWMVSYDYNGKLHMFAMNGQTGKIVGKPPISSGRVAAWFSGVAGGTFVVIKSIAWMMGGGI
ncbi:TFIIB-type zinc ribbon-containing protein [Anaerobacillus alkaliphilus]|uniref:TFIIB-type zinc ribbon-containing protein n=1 Tax=Anaerobacillus alkaliphilus TaxID=1548597 RepID=A0A4Q0VT93_9BACI|nr:TFIIB-type zinc ribbon-containing protein [Anaerobacillus alkaliphilus]RXJ01633.1 TFIIB-type zinc ribbon-containing protein [Anaerobacillus alkaliphilus]